MFWLLSLLRLSSPTSSEKITINSLKHPERHENTPCNSGVTTSCLLYQNTFMARPAINKPNLPSQTDENLKLQMLLNSFWCFHWPKGHNSFCTVQFSLFLSEQRPWAVKRKGWGAVTKAILSLSDLRTCLDTGLSCKPENIQHKDMPSLAQGE